MKPQSGKSCQVRSAVGYTVHIKLSDFGWILEKCASELAKRSSSVTFGPDANPSADIQYYINYSAYRQRVSPIEIGYFTHIEPGKDGSRSFFHVAKSVDFSVCHARRYADELGKGGIRDVAIIPPGVDLEAFQPKIKIGVVGRTYHTGRKGEALVSALLEMQGIEWRFTGTGWPVPSLALSESQLPGFYNDLDYLLVPSLYEGGPMCVVEALACGIPVIASDVGWVNEFPHIEFENGNIESLRCVLEKLLAARLELRKSVLDVTWTKWAESHFALFDRLAFERRIRTHVALQNSAVLKPIRAALFLHGDEKGTRGGPTIRVPRTVSALVKSGIEASLGSAAAVDAAAIDVAHVFNIWRPESCMSILSREAARGAATVLSPIFLNLSHSRLFAEKLPKIFLENSTEKAIDQALSAVADTIECEPQLPFREPYPGFHAQVRACVKQADFTICLSRYESLCLAQIGAEPNRSALIRNVIDAVSFAGADSTLFSAWCGIEDYILCVGRIEPRKNQLVLAHAAKTLRMPVVFIGHVGDHRYMKAVKSAAGDLAVFVPRLEADDPLLKSAYAGASVFCLPSWSEGAPLAALEAAAAGAPLVLSDRSGEREYFGSFAAYVNPANIDALRDALVQSAKLKADEGRRSRLQTLILESYSWPRHAEETAKAYRAALDRKACSASSAEVGRSPDEDQMTGLSERRFVPGGERNHRLLGRIAGLFWKK